jgi:hypothetical protein
VPSPQPCMSSSRSVSNAELLRKACSHLRVLAKLPAAAVNSAMHQRPREAHLAQRAWPAVPPEKRRVEEQRVEHHEHVERGEGVLRDAPGPARWAPDIDVATPGQEARDEPLHEGFPPGLVPAPERRSLNLAAFPSRVTVRWCSWMPKTASSTAGYSTHCRKVKETFQELEVGGAFGGGGEHWSLVVVG